MESRNKSLIKNTSLLGIGTICTKGIMFIMAPLLTRWLSSSDYGTFDLITEYATLLIPILSLGTGEAVFRFLLDNNSEREEGKIISTLFLYNLLVIIIIGAIAFILSICIPDRCAMILSAAFLLIGETLYQFLMMTMRGGKHLEIYTASNIIYVFCLAIFTTVFVFILGLGLPGILLGYGCGYYSSVIYMFLYSKVYKDIRVGKADFSMFKKAIRYSLPLIPNSVSWWIINVSDRTIISAFLGTSFNAVYAIANKIPSLCQNLFRVFHLSWQQSAIETMNDTDKDQYYSSVMNNMIRIIGSICILVLGINYWFFKILYTEEYFFGYYQAPILTVAIIFSMIAQFMGSIYVARMESKINGATTALAAVVNVIINLMFVREIGLYAASISTMSAYIMLFVFRYIDIKRKMDLKISGQSIVTMLVIVYFTVSSYIEIEFLRGVNLFLSVIIFCYMNSHYIRVVMTEVGRKVKKYMSKS